MQSIPFSQARAHLADTLSRVALSSEPTLISRRGHAAAVLMSMPQFERLSGPAKGFADRLKAWRATSLAEIVESTNATDTTDPWAQVRDASPGREVTW